MDDLRASGTIARDSGRGRDLVIATVNTGNWQAMYEGGLPGVATVREAITLAEHLGFAPLARAMRQMSIQMLVDAGEVQEAFDVLDGLRREGGSMPLLPSVHRMQALRGQRAEALAGADAIDARVPTARADDQITLLARSADVRTAFGDVDAGLRNVEKVLSIEDRSRSESYVGSALPFLIRAACGAGRVDLAEQMLSEVRAPFPRATHAQAAARSLVAEHRGRLEEAAAGHQDAAAEWTSFTMPIEAANAHIGHARSLIALGRKADAAAPLAAARTICSAHGRQTHAGGDCRDGGRCRLCRYCLGSAEGCSIQRRC